jgi:hypothetical protein
MLESLNLNQALQEFHGRRENAGKISFLKELAFEAGQG